MSSDDHIHLWQLAKLDKPTRNLTMYEQATAEPEDLYSTWACPCGAVMVIKTKGEDE